MHPDTEKWFADRTFQEPAWTPSCLTAAKAGAAGVGGTAALNEEATVGAIVAAIVPLTRGDTLLVDELVVVDSGSTTARSRWRPRLARGWCGAPTSSRTSRRCPARARCVALAATTGDVIVFIDSDLVDFDPAFVPSPLGLP